MKLKIVSVYDNAAKAFSRPGFSPNEHIARREFGEFCNQADHPFCKHASDFVLFELGEFDDESGAITAHKAPLKLSLALELRSNHQPQLPMFAGLEKGMHLPQPDMTLPRHRARKGKN